MRGPLISTFAHTAVSSQTKQLCGFMTIMNYVNCEFELLAFVQTRPRLMALQCLQHVMHNRGGGVWP